MNLHKIKTVRYLFVFFILVLVSTASGQSCLASSNTWPPYLTLKTDTSVTVNWKTENPSRGSLIFFKEPTSNKGTQFTEGKASPYHHISLENLVPGSLYSYRVNQVNLPEMKNQPIRFRMPFGREDLNFFVISDTQAPMIPGLLKTDQTRQKMVIEAMVRDSSIPDFLVNCGDHVESDTSPEWSDYFQTIFPLVRKTPVFPVMGNHEEMSEYYFKAFSFPNGGGHNGWEWHSFNVRNALFIFLNTNFRDLDHINKQIDWLKSTLNQQRKKTWQFVFCHHPLYSSGRKYGGSESTFASLLEPIFTRYAVDVVFSGHHHAYQRIHRNGIHYIVSAGGGGSFGRLRRQKIEGTIRTIEKTLHYLRIHIMEGKLTMEMRTVGRENAEGVIEPRDEIFDHFEILKR